MASSNKPSFVFMHYSNPSKDSKLLENRQKVAKYAMLGRQKTKSNNPTSTNKTTSTSANASASTPSLNGRSSATPQPTAHNQTIPNGDPSIQWDTPDRSVPNAQQPSSNLYDASNEAIDGFQDFDPTLHDSSDLWSDSDFAFMDNPPSLQAINANNPSYDLPLLENVPYQSYNSTNSNGFPLNTPTNDLRIPQHTASYGDDSLPRQTSPSNTISQKSKSAKARQDRLKLNHQASASSRVTSHPSSTALARFSPVSSFANRTEGPLNSNINSPKSLLSAAPADPFNSLPIQANAHTHELLYQYMNARLISTVYANGSPDTLGRIRKMRHTVWGPLMWNSKASLNALVAYVEATPGLPIRSRSHDFLFSHVQAAMQAVREALSKPSVATDDSICFAVVLLMLTAQRTSNLNSYAAHAAGLATLLSFRTDALRVNGEIGDTVERLRTFYITDPRDQCLYCRNAQETSGSPPSQYSTDVDAFSLSAEQRGRGLRDLVTRGLLSPAMNAFIEPAMIWSTLAERARKDKLSAAIGATHAWIDEGEFSLQGPIHYLDTACHTSVRLCFYLSSWLDWQHSCPAVRRLAKAVYLSLKHADLDRLMVESPDVLVWMSLIAGPLCEDESRAWFTQLMSRARANTDLLDKDFQQVLDGFAEQFVWSSTMTSGAERFWNESLFSETDFFSFQQQELWNT